MNEQLQRISTSDYCSTSCIITADSFSLQSSSLYRRRLNLETGGDSPSSPAARWPNGLSRKLMLTVKFRSQRGLIWCHSPSTVRLQSVYSQPTVSLQSAYSPSTVSLQSVYSQPTVSLQSVYSPSTVSLQPAYSQSTARLQSAYSQSTVRLQSVYSQPTVSLQSAYSPSTVDVVAVPRSDCVSVCRGVWFGRCC